MPELSAGLELLRLAQSFPPVATSDWEALIQKDLKGADYAKKLIWKSDEGIAVRPYYRREDLIALGELADLVPAQPPFTRGPGKTWEDAPNWIPPAGAIRADLLHEAGATAVQELGFALSEAVEKLSEAADPATHATTFVFAVGSNYFFEIAKLRAARLLWTAAANAIVPESAAAAESRIHVRTARANKSLVDPYSNLLRVTTEAMSAAIGGCDSLTVEPFGFDAHLAANIGRVLREEAHLGRVADPAGGSYYIESLTDALAREAWKQFQQVEAAGGWSAALNSGMLEQALATARESKAKAVALRRRTLVGVNNYPDLRNNNAIAPEPDPLPNDPFPQIRLAEPFEALRERTSRHAGSSGRLSQIVLLKRGDLKMRVARANFCLNFFGCAGFDIVEFEELPVDNNYDAIVLCSSDPEYLALAAEVCPQLQVPVLVAGNPKEQFQELQQLGVVNCVHILSNAVETIGWLQDKLGMKPLEASH